MSKQARITSETHSSKYFAEQVLAVYRKAIGPKRKKTFKDKLKSNLSREIQYKITFIGPNRDDFYFDLNGKNLSLYGSNGQIRSAVLALKLAEVKLFTDVLSDTHILLLDDIFSELDIDKRNKVIKYLDNDIQTIVTTTDIENIDKNVRNKANVYRIENGKIISREII
jgi:DNA replication and repair protein RecF